ncbi:hypothetical protein [Fulvimarina manganoxydans]|nr:hypothetical protein [Fulvimarina manganoxydans]
MGDCYRTALACVLGLDRDEIPHLFQDNQNCEGLEFDALYNRELAKRGLTTAQFCMGTDLDLALECMSKWVEPDTWWILSATSGNDENHAFVCRGDVVVFDPSQNDAGIKGPTSTGHYWATVVTVRGPDLPADAFAGVEVYRRRERSAA